MFLIEKERGILRILKKKREKINLRNCDSRSIVRRAHSERTCSRILRFNARNTAGESEEAKARHTLNQLPRRNVIIAAFRLAEGSQVSTRTKQDWTYLASSFSNCVTRVAVNQIARLHYEEKFHRHLKLYLFS